MKFHRTKKRKKIRKFVDSCIDGTYDLDTDQIIAKLNMEKEFISRRMHFNERRRRSAKSPDEIHSLRHSDDLYRDELKKIDARIAMLNSQALILECDDKPLNVDTKNKRAPEDELKHAYCAKCASPDLKITRVIQIECRKCRRKRLIISKLDENKR